MGEAERRTPVEEAQRLYDIAESRAADAMETVVRRGDFGELLGRTTENAMALARLGHGALDAMVRTLRLAGSQDVVHLGHQLARTEDKLEMVLREVERLQEDLAAQRAELGGLFERSEPPSRRSSGRSREASRSQGSGRSSSGGTAGGSSSGGSSSGGGSTGGRSGPNGGSSGRRSSASS